MKLIFYSIILFMVTTLGYVELSIADSSKVIKMGYRTTAKLPYIAANPDNSGLFQDLYSEAAKRIGYRLEIVRIPKIRVLQRLEDGSLDFYPGFAFNQERTRYAHWIFNGIVQRDVIITRDDVGEVRSMKDLKWFVQLKALGNPDYLKGYDTSKIVEHTVAELSLFSTLKMLELKRADFYIYEEDTLKYFIKSNKVKGFKLHDGLITRVYPMYAGFSRKSPLYEGEINPLYDPSQKKSVKNFPYKLKQGSVIDRFYQALQKLVEEGFTKKLYQKYFE